MELVSIRATPDYPEGNLICPCGGTARKTLRLESFEIDLCDDCADSILLLEPSARE